MKEGGGGILGGDFFSLRKVAAEGGSAATENECGGDEFETGVVEEGVDVSKKEVLKESLGEERERMYAYMASGGDGSRKETFAGKREMGVRTTVKIFVRGDKGGEKDVSGTSDETWLKSRKGKVEERRKIKKVVEMEAQ